MSTESDTAFFLLMEQGKFSDCRIKVGSETFDCHKIILASVSDYFDRLFLAESTIYSLVNVKPETFKNFLKYAYTRNENDFDNYSSAMIMELFECGSKWLVKSMTNICSNHLKIHCYSMPYGDMLKMFEFSHKMDNLELINVSEELMTKRFAKSLNCFEALHLTPNVFEKYVLATSEVLPEVERFKMIQAYLDLHGLKFDKSNQSSLKEIKDKKAKIINSDTENDDYDLPVPEELSPPTLGIGEMEKCHLEPRNSDFVHKLLSYINYKLICSQDFYEVVGKSDLLTFQEKFENLYLTIMSSDNKDED
ncbi:kelch-like protein 41 [Drosophila elegans]|uniref:kelch-like protein 41 n=1 Tax=Drosophila elegans TaxID=30023 RepID=UPI0007E6B928|nr:kelch-like protein 41 [Drosophila elegans]